jgi:hypothetical protein
MKLKPLCALRSVLCAALFALSAHAALIEGTVLLPKAKAPPVPNQRYTVLSVAGVLSPFPPVAVVYLEGRFPPPASLPVRQMAQKDLNFAPAFMAVQKGTRVEFPNLDDTYHNIFSYSPAKRFDLGRYRSSERPIPSELFDVPGLVTLRCDIHEHMRALILVVDTAYFVVTDLQGRYRLQGLPAGSYVLKAWVDSRHTLARPVVLEPDSALHVDFP